MPDRDEEYGVFWGDALYESPAKKEPIIENLLYERDCACISSMPGAGKSILALQWLSCLTTGTKFLGVYPVHKPKRVLYIQTEGDRVETIERINRMKEKLPFDDSMWVHMNLPALSINTEPGIRELLRLAKAPAMKYDVVFLDPLYTTVKGTMSSDEVATDWVRNMRRFKEEYGNVAFVILHHDSKAVYTQDTGALVDKGINDIFGSVFWAAFFNQNFKLKVNTGIHVLESGKQRSGKIVDRITMKMVEPSPLLYVSAEPDIPAKVKVLVSYLSSVERATIKEMQANTLFSRATLYRVLAELKDDKHMYHGMVNGIAYYGWQGNGTVGGENIAKKA